MVRAEEDEAIIGGFALHSSVQQNAGELLEYGTTTESMPLRIKTCLVNVSCFTSPDEGVGFGVALPMEEELVSGEIAADEGTEFGLLAEEGIGSSPRDPPGVKISLSDEHPQNKHTTPTHPKNVVIFFMPVNIVYILGLNEKKDFYYVCRHYDERRNL